MDDESGLGTVIVGRLIEEYGGDIEVSETGTDGTTVTITFPLATTVAEETRDSSEQFRTPSA